MRISDWSSDVCSSVLPVRGRVRDLRMAVSDGDELLLDTPQGQLVVRPTSAMEHAFESRLKVTQKRKAEYAALRDLPSVSVDGQPVTLLVNAGLRDDLGALDTTGAEGIGLFRTEFQRSEEHTSELQSPMRIAYHVFCL